MQNPQITVAIPTLNRPGYLRETVASVLAQTHSNLDILISDNASDDDTPSVIQGFNDPRIRTFRQERRLPMASHWNACLAQAQGEFFILLSDDDLLTPIGLEALLEPLQAQSVALAYSPFITIDGLGEPVKRSAQGPVLASGAEFIRKHLARRLDVMPSGVLARTAAVKALGGFPEIGTASDLGLRLLLATQGQVACLPEPILSYRVHGSNLSGKATAVIASHMALLTWSRDRCELTAFAADILAFVHRGIAGYGFRSALEDDAPGRAASLQALDSMGLKFGKRMLSRWLILGGRWPPTRCLMRIRDGVMKKRARWPA